MGQHTPIDYRLAAEQLRDLLDHFNSWPARALSSALRESRIDGGTVYGPECCVVGTLAIASGEVRRPHPCYDEQARRRHRAEQLGVDVAEVEHSREWREVRRISERFALRWYGDARMAGRGELARVFSRIHPRPDMGRVVDASAATAWAIHEVDAWLAANALARGAA